MRGIRLAEHLKHWSPETFRGQSEHLFPMLTTSQPHLDVIRTQVLRQSSKENSNAEVSRFTWQGTASCVYSPSEVFIGHLPMSVHCAYIHIYIYIIYVYTYMCAQTGTYSISNIQYRITQNNVDICRPSAHVYGGLYAVVLKFSTGYVSRQHTCLRHCWQHYPRRPRRCQ